MTQFIHFMKFYVVMRGSQHKIDTKVKCLPSFNEINLDQNLVRHKVSSAKVLQD